MPNRHRQSTRLSGFDYSRAGAYFVTLCSWERDLLFGSVTTDAVELTQAGQVVHDQWLASFQMRREIRPDAFIIMPNHFHAIVWMRHGQHPTLGKLIGGFKSAVSSQINALNDTPGRPVWQRNYHDRIIRDDQELNRIRQYIMDNPLKWPEDPNHPTKKRRQAVGASRARPIAAPQKNATPNK